LYNRQACVPCAEHMEKSGTHLTFGSFGAVLGSLCTVEVLVSCSGAACAAGVVGTEEGAGVASPEASATCPSSPEEEEEKEEEEEHGREQSGQG